jgi:sugar O-acyltransferase (sialic acid O-acetyltransferase NeuD family)
VKGLLIVGAGGHGKVVAETAEAAGGFRQIAFVDDRVAELNGSMRWPVIGTLSDTAGLLQSYCAAVVAIGDAELRLEILDRLAMEGFALPVLCHPAAWVSPSASLGAGTVVFAQAVIQADAELGQGVIVNTSASIDHDCVLGDGVHVCPGANLGGGVRVGNGSWIGIGACVIQYVRIGENVTVAAGAAVIAGVGDGMTVGGVPARIIKR